MAEKAAGGNPANAGGNANAGGGNDNKGAGRNNRRRPLRSKRRGRKPEEGGEPREPRTDTRTDARPEARSEARNAPRSEPRAGREQRGQHSAPKPVDKNLRDNRERRRRRRMRSKQRGPGDNTPQVVEDILKDLPPLVPAFVYTHVSRPAMRDNFEFRTEHFSKVTRKMEDFHIDLTPIYPDGSEEIKGVAYMPPLADSAEFAGEFARAAAKAAEGNFDAADYDDADYAEFDSPPEIEHVAGEVGGQENGKKNDGANDNEVESAAYDNPEWDAEQSADAALLDGASFASIADDFYADLDDSIVDEYPDEDIDA